MNAVNASQQSKQAVDLAQFFNEHYLADDDTVAGDDCPKQNMPVFLNYGTNRLVLDVPLRIRKSILSPKEQHWKEHWKTGLISVLFRVVSQSGRL